MKNKVTILFLVLIMLATASISGTFGLEAQPEERKAEQGTAYDNAAPVVAPVRGERSLKAQAAPNEQADGIVIDKTASPVGDGTYKVRLEAYTTGAVSTQTLSIPSDIVLVLDQSGSMAECMECGKKIDGVGQNTHYKETFQVEQSASFDAYYVKNYNRYNRVYYCNVCKGWFDTQVHSNRTHTASRMYLPKTGEDDTSANHVQFYVAEQCKSRKAALTDALNAFVTEVCNKASGEDGKISTTDDNVTHRIAMVGFANEARFSYGNTELFIGNNHYTYGTSAQSRYGTSFQDMSTIAGQRSVAASISQLDADGATYINLGMEMASGILRNNPVPAGELRNRVVVVFTDGAPGFNGSYDTNPSYGNSGDAAIVANRAISQGKITKEECGATVYTVGIFSGADGTSAGNQNGTDSERANWFMQQLSSNNGVVQDPGYYLSASDSETLTNIFKQISQQICTPDIELGEETVVLDKVSPYFTPPADTKDVDIFTATYDGSKFGTEVETSLEPSLNEDGTICVTGFDFNENFVTNTPKEDGTFGKKLIIEFTVEPRKGFLGGNGVPTNADNAGVYSGDGTLIEAFPQPVVDVPIKKVSVEAADKNVYLFGNLNTQQLKEDMKVSAGEGDDVVIIDGTKENYGLEKWQSGFVNISIAIAEDAYEDLVSDAEYSVTCKILPKTGTGGKEATVAGAINVFVPKLNFKDSTKFYGEAIDEGFPENLMKTEWIHEETTSSDVKMYGETPAVTLKYEEDEGTIKEGLVNTKTDFGVKVKAAIGEKGIDDYWVMAHEDCAVGETVPEGKAFLIHVKTCQLTITKTGGNSQEPYVFVIQRGGEKYTEGTIVGNGTLTICQLPVGNYTVEEENLWSWRYAPSFEEGNTVSLSRQNPFGGVICQNKQTKEQWLNGYSDVVQNIFGTIQQNKTAQ